MLVRCILAKWAQTPSARRVWEGDYTEEAIMDLNSQGFNIYYLPNYPSEYDPTITITGAQIDVFEYVFVDFDLKSGTYPSKEAFLEKLSSSPLMPSRVVDSGGGIHAYWRVSDLDPMSFLRLGRRLMRFYNTDDAVQKIYQLMRVPNTYNVKIEGDPRLCEELVSNESTYTCEELDKALPQITREDEDFCQAHYDQTYNLKAPTEVSDKIPLKFEQLLRGNSEIKDIWSGNVADRSKADFRLGHLMFSAGFTRDEAMSVLVNSRKARDRAPVHRVSYAENIIDKVWTYEAADNKQDLQLSNTVREILDRCGEAIKGVRFPCWKYLDSTAHGFRLGQVIGLVAGSGVGKTAMALNMFEGFVQNNPDYDHFFVPLEQPANEIADRWKTMCGDKTHLYDKVHIISNYAPDGTYRNLSLAEIKEYILRFQADKKRKIGCVVIDHIGALKKKSAEGENQGLMDICHEMKAFAVQTNTMLVMQSQAPREKAGIGDLELSKDAAYGTVYFESYCDYMLGIWQPLKRCYGEPACPTVTAFKFCKIRHKKMGVDEIIEDVRYRLFFEPKTERLRELTQDEEKSFEFFNNKATNARKADKKTDVLPYNSLPWSEAKKEINGETGNNKNSR